jgi:hypothetical protein
MRLSIGLGWLLGGERLAFGSGLWSGWVSRRDSMRTAALWQVFARASSTGRTPAWASRRSVGVDLRPPVMASVAILWSFCRDFNVPTEPELFTAPTGLFGGEYQMSRPYAIFGNATAM